MTTKISAVINTLNEASNIAYALRSLAPWVDEMVVVDMYSDDDTARIAREHGARVVMHERTFAVDGGREFALAQASGEWVILLDADEIVPPHLAERLRAIAREGSADAVEIPFLNYLLGAPLMHTGWAPHEHSHPRFFRRGAMIPSDKIHGFVRPREGARVVRLPFRADEAIHHFNYLDSAHFLEKLNRYTTVEAHQRYEAGERGTIGRAIVSGARDFLARYLRRRGYRDGWRGFYLSLFMAFYRISIQAKLTELDALGGREQVRTAYRGVADGILAGYDDAPTAAGPATR